MRCSWCDEEYEAKYDNNLRLCKKCRFIIETDVTTIADKKEVDIIKNLIRYEDLIA